MAGRRILPVARLATWGTLVLLTAAYLFGRQDAYWSDGRALIGFVSRGGWVHHHLLYLPVAHAVHGLLRPFAGADPEPALYALSAVSAAVAAALALAALRELGVRLVPALIAVALMASAPAAWWYATCIEVHALHMAAAAGAVLWAVRAQRAGRLCDALPAALLLTGLAGTHMVGVLWLPALALAVASPVAQGTEPRRPRRLAPAALVLFACAAAWAWSEPTRSLLSKDAHASALRVLRHWHAGSFWREVVLPLGFAWLAPLAVLAWRVRGEWRAWLRQPLFLPTVALFAAFLPFGFALYSQERGAYYVSLLPPLAVLGGLSLARLPRWTWWVAALLVTLQLGATLRSVWRFEHRYPGADWLPALVRDMDGRGLVLVRDYEEWKSVVSHSRLDALSPRAGSHVFDLGSLAVQEVALDSIDYSRARGRRVALSRALLAADEPELAAFVARVRERLAGSRRDGGRGYEVYEGLADAR